MMNKLKKTIFVSLALIGFVLVSGSFNEANAQCNGDPFCKPIYAKTPNPNAPKPAPGTGVPANGVKGDKTGGLKGEKPPVVAVGIPDITARINYYKRLREELAEKGLPIPKPTVVMTLDDLLITGIFRTPRGMAAMVEAKPISLSYTIYPGEKFFNGQLVAIEENRLVFRKIIKMSDGKFVASEENKALRQYTQQEEIQGTAPTNASVPADTKPQTAAVTQPTAEGEPGKPPQPISVVPLVDEMNRQPAETQKAGNEKTEKGKKGKASTTKKPTKVASNKKQ